MENQYQKTYPDVMAGKKIMYIHGFGSAGSTNTAQLLREYLPECEVVSPDVPLHPQEAVALLRETAEREKPDLIIGTSMGGMYAEMMYGFDRILVNPAFRMAETMKEHGLTGKQVFHNPRKDGIQEFIVTKALVKEYKDITENNFSNATSEKEQGLVYGMFGDKDDTVDTYDLFRSHYAQAIRFHGGHRLIDKAVFHYLIPIIRYIDDKQEGRERRTIFIHDDALRDSYGKPMSSLHKAYEFLIENYNVFFIAPAPSGDHDVMAGVLDWLEEYISAPAWNRTVFTNYPGMLYGDYMISRKGREEFMGTSILLGSEEFKTWEEVIVFFDRLGGQ